MKTVIEMAEEAGATHYWHLSRLERFAELVRADERNSWPAEMEAMERQVNILTDALNDRQRWFDAVTAQHKQAILAEREACAKVCDDASVPLTGELQSDAQWSALCLATAIRARSDT